MTGGHRHSTDRVDGTIIGECPNVDDDPEEHLLIEIEYRDAADTDTFEEFMDEFSYCWGCGAELDYIHQQEQSEVLE